MTHLEADTLALQAAAAHDAANGIGPHSTHNLTTATATAAATYTPQVHDAAANATK